MKTNEAETSQNAANAELEKLERKRRKMSLRWRLFFCALFYLPALYCKMSGDYVTAAVLAVAGMGAFGGYRAGALNILTMFVGITAAILFAPALGLEHEETFGQYVGTTGLTNRFLSVGAIGLGITLAVSSFGISLGGKILRSLPRLDSMNRWCGFCIGGLEGAVAIAFFLGGLMVLEPIEQQRAQQRDPDDVRGQVISRFILSTAASAKESRVGPAIVAYNPFIRIPQLNKVEEVQQSVQVLSDPAKIQGLLYHPAIRKLQHRPEVREAVNELTSDPEIREILRSGQKIDRSTAMKLLSHPAVMKLVDQPGFVEEATRVIHSTTLFAVAP